MNRKSLFPLGWDDRLEKAYDRYDRSDQRPGRVARVDRGVCTLLGPGGVWRASVGGDLLVAAAHDSARLPCPGDWVVVRTWPDARVTIEAILPRRTTVRHPPGRPAASNVDIVVVVDPAMRRDPALIEGLRALAAPGRTLGLVGAADKLRAGMVDSLAGAAVLPLARGGLVPLPNGGAVIDTGGGHLDIDWDDIDGTPLGGVVIAMCDVRECPTGHPSADRSVEPG